jgi:ribulose-phosphate 3-epimerase
VSGAVPRSRTGASTTDAGLVAAANVLIAGSAVFKGGTCDACAANIAAIRKSAEAARSRAAA